MMIRRANVARCKEHGLQRQVNVNIAPRAPRGRKSRKKHWKGRECKIGIKDLGSRRPLCLRKERRRTNSIGGWSSEQRSHLGSGGTLKKTLSEIFRGKIPKTVVETSSRLRKVSD
jgi:hypothetical protein